MADDNLYDGSSYGDYREFNHDDVGENNFEDAGGFSNYIPHAKDPTPWAFLACVILCVILVLLLPFGVAIIQLQRRRCSKKKALDAGFIMKPLNIGGGGDEEEPVVRSPTIIEVILGSDSPVQPLDSKEEDRIRSSTNLDLERNDTVLALCRPNMKNRSDPFTRYLTKAADNESDITNSKQFSGLPLEKSSTFVQHDASSNAVKLMWNPLNVVTLEDTHSLSSVIDREDSVSNKVVKNDDSESHTKKNIHLRKSPEDIMTSRNERVLYELVQSSTGDIKVRSVESRLTPLQRSRTLNNVKSCCAEIKHDGDAGEVLKRSKTDIDSRCGRLGPSPFLTSVSKRWRNRAKQESLLSEDQTSPTIDDTLLCQSQQLGCASSVVDKSQGHILEKEAEMLPNQRSFDQGTPYYLSAHVPSHCTFDDRSFDSMITVGDNRKITITDAVTIRKRTKKISIYSSLAKKAVGSVISYPERRRRRERRRLYREKTTRQGAIEKFIRKIYNGEDSKSITSESTKSQKPTMMVNVIPISSTPKIPARNHSEQNDCEYLQDGNGSDDTSSTQSTMTDGTLEDLNISDFPISDIIDATLSQYDDTDTTMVAGWQKGYDHYTQTVYYYNPGTGERSTECPADPILSKHEIGLGFSRTRSWMCYFCSSGFFRKILKCLSFDNEMKEIFKLAAPYTSIAVVSSIFSLLEVGIIGTLLGTNDLSAYFAVTYIVGLATMFLYGIMQALHVTCCQAIGAENFKLAGQYMQLSVWIHQIYFIPLMICFWDRFEKIVLWLGFNEETSESAQMYAQYAMSYEAIVIFDTVITELLEVNGQENYSAILSSLQSALSFVAVLMVVKMYDRAQLWMIGGVHILVMICFFLINIIVVIWKGWLQEYWCGLVRSNPLSMTRDNLKAFLNQALPLSIGYIIEYGEWEVLFIFATIIGPAEVAVWGLLGEIWSLTEGIANSATGASEVRVAKILGSSESQLAKYSAEKSLCLGVILSWIMAVFLLSLQSFIPKWMTNDETLQSMLSELLPLVSLGIIVLSIGNTSWSILCAQGRSHLATVVSASGCVCISMPLAFLSTFGLNLNLKGLVASLVIGYSVSGFFNSLFFMSSNWGKISRKMSKGTRKKKVADVEMTTILAPDKGKVDEDPND